MQLMIWPPSMLRPGQPLAFGRIMQKLCYLGPAGSGVNKYTKYRNMVISILCIFVYDYHVLQYPSSQAHDVRMHSKLIIPLCLNSSISYTKTSSECRWSMRSKQLLTACLRNTVWQREFKVLSEELLDVWTLDVVRLLDLDDFEDL